MAPSTLRALRMLPAIAVSLLFVAGLGAGYTLAPGTSTSALHAPAAVAHSASAAPSGSASAVAGGSAIAGGGSGYTTSGPGTFFTSQAVQNVTGNYPGCAFYHSGSYKFPYCWNSTSEPTLNVTTDGYTGLAYTVWTNDSPCATLQGNATTEIGFETSTNFGTSWNTPIILGNPNCSNDTAQDWNYSSAFTPSLTSLANGTFVLTYVEENVTAAYYYGYDGAYPNNLGCEYTAHNRIVVTESYDHGVTWTSPDVLQQTDLPASSYLNYNCFAPGIQLLHPIAVATGDTIYVAWTEYQYPFIYCCAGFGNALLHLAVSADGGQNWTNASVPPTFGGYGPEGYDTMAMSPDLLVTPSGELYMSYATGYDTQLVCGVYCSNWYNDSVLVAWSSDNGTTFNYTTVTQSAGVPEYSDFSNDYYADTYSYLAYSALTGQMFITFASYNYTDVCYYYSTYSNCNYFEDLPDVFFANSSNAGLNWSAPASVTDNLVRTGGPANGATLPAITVLSTGQVDISYMAENNSVCISYYCGAMEEEFVFSKNNGTTWSQPALVSEFYNASSCVFCFPYMIDMYLGVDAALISAGHSVLLAWPHVDDGIYGYNGWGYQGAVNVETSQLYTGAGITVSFTQTGLPAGAVWDLTVGGYFRDGPGGSTLSISGVPPAYGLPYYVFWQNTSYGVAWIPSGSPSSPVNFATNNAVAVTFTEIVLVEVASLPAFGYSVTTFLGGYGYSNIDMNPLPGLNWVSIGTSLSLSVTYVSTVYCYPCLNMTFVSWVGSGSGSYSGTSMSPSVTVTGPINETATFTINSWCYAFPVLTCHNMTYSQSFVENGLPGGVPWGVTVNGADGNVTTLYGNTTSLSVGLPAGLSSWIGWTVPEGTPGLYWVPTSTSASAFSAPSPTIVLNYSLQSITGTDQLSVIQEVGLPNATAWNYQVGSVDGGANQAPLTATVTAGTSVALDAASVYFEDGTGFYLSSVTVRPLVVNSSSYSVSPSGTTTLDGPAILTYNFAPMFLVTVTASTGGTVSAGSQWVHQGSSLALTAIPNSNYHFVSWTGSGAGSASSGTSTQISVKPTAPVSEFATFRTDFPPTWNVTLTSVGLPASTPFTIVLGNGTYSGVGAITIGDLSTGSYAVSAPTISGNSSNTTQYVPLSITSTSAITNGLLNVSSNATVTVTYQTQYTLTVFSTPGGTVTGYPDGTYWVVAGTSVSLTATPDTGYEFAGWSGTVSATTPTVSVPVNGVANETAQFLVRPTPIPATYSLAVTEQGLPTGTTWSLSVGGTGLQSTSSTLTVTSLNGSYLVTAPTIYPAGTSGVRWVSNVDNQSLSVLANSSLSVTYWEQFQVTVTTSSGGTATPTTSWLNATSSETLTATPGSGQMFVSWNGTGAGSTNSTSVTITVTANGPVTEQANFAPIQTPVTKTTSGSNSNSGTEMTVFIVLGLLVAGLIVGLLVGRRGGAKPGSAAAPEAWSGPENPESPGMMDAGDPAAAEAPPLAPYDEGPPSQ